MAQCANCGQFNNAESNFCRFCGTKFGVNQPPPVQGFTAPRPYSWQTDEFQVSKPEARKTQQIDQVEPLNLQFPGTNQNYQPFQQPQQAPPLAYRQPQQPLTNAYRCPRCMTNVLPRFERRVSTAGWIVFAVLIVATFTIPLCWIGLLIREDTHTCPTCGARVG
jgi:RNA polymerase subunit RPABC4/transcription elongation factor Spt4